MATSVAQPTLTRELVTVAGLLVRLAHPGQASLHRAVEKAEARLLELPWRVDGGILQIASYSHPTEVHFASGDECDCPTRKGVCWHRGAWAVLSAIAATGVTPVASLPLANHRVLDDMAGLVHDFPNDSIFDDYGDLVAVGSDWDETACDDLFV